MSVISVIEGQFVQVFDRARNVPYLGVLLRATEDGQHHRSKDLAASIAYFTFLSLFPLILGLVALGGYVLRSDSMQQRVNALIVELLPVSAEMVTQITDSLVRIRDAAGITGVLLLIWSASKMVGALSRAINLALEQKRNYAIYLSSLRNFLLTLVVAILVVFTLAIAPLLDLLASLQLDVIGERWNSVLRASSGHTAGVLVTTALVTMTYALIPHRRLPMSKLLPGILTSVLLIEAGKSLFVTYVETAADYSAVYGSLSSIIVLMLWLYFCARVLVYGAEVIRVNDSAVELAGRVSSSETLL